MKPSRTATAAPKFTVLPYLYRDSSNYKRGGKIFLEGLLSADNLDAIRAKLNDGEYFIPFDLKGLDIAELQSLLPSFPSEDDHVWHELQIEAIETCGELAEGENSISVEEFLAAFAAIKHSNSWDVVGTFERLGLER